MPQMLKEDRDFHEVVSVILIVRHCWCFPFRQRISYIIQKANTRFVLLKTNFCGSFIYILRIYLSVSTCVYASKETNMIEIPYPVHDAIVKVRRRHKITENFRMTKQFNYDVISTSYNACKLKFWFCWIQWYFFKDCRTSNTEVMEFWTWKYASKNKSAPWGVSAVAKVTIEHRRMHKLLSNSRNGLHTCFFKDGLKMKIPSHNKIIAFVYKFIDTPSYNKKSYIKYTIHSSIQTVLFIFFFYCRSSC